MLKPGDKVEITEYQSGFPVGTICEVVKKTIDWGSNPQYLLKYDGRTYYQNEDCMRKVEEMTSEVNLGNKKLYKVLLIDGSPANADARKHSKFKYDLPLKKATGWTPRIDELIPCLKGYHVIDAEHLMQWIEEYTTHPTKRGAARDRDIIVVECEVDGSVLPADDKYVAHSIRLKKILYRWRDVKDAKLKAIADAKTKSDKKVADLKAKQEKEMADLLASVNKDTTACILSKGS